MVEGQEVKRYKNIDLPDMLKEVEMLDFHFNVPEDGKITFEISYAQGILPEVFPEPRAKMTRAEKAAAKAAAKESEAEETGSKKSKNRSIKYVCPCCGTIIRATREVNVICGDCGEPFERALLHGGKARRIRPFRARQKNSPPNRKAYVV